MSKMITVAIDAMGGDFAPVSAIEGSVDALAANKNVRIILVGDSNALNKGLENLNYDKERLEIVHASQVIGTDEHPMMAVQRKKDASILVAMKLIKEGRADAVISAGSTGAMLLGCRKYVGLIKGIERPALAPLIPNINGFSLLIDCGANVDARPASLVKFAKMGSIYMQHLMNMKEPRVGLLNIGTLERCTRNGVSFNGSILTDVAIETPVKVVSIRGGSVPKNAPEAGKAGEIVKKAITVADDAIKFCVKNAVQEIAESVNLEEAEVIVSGGRGMGNAENFAALKELADLCGGVIGCTRPVYEEGWISRAHQVGQSGKIVAPKVYFAFGISGATQHVSGMIGSGYIVAVNKDEDAPIFDVADVGIVGNAMDVLPVMIEEIRKLKA